MGDAEDFFALFFDIDAHLPAFGEDDPCKLKGMRNRDVRTVPEMGLSGRVVIEVGICVAFPCHQMADA